MSDLQDLMRAFQEVTEKRKLDPVGKEDGDIDNDGDTDSSDAYLKNRRKKVDQAMDKEESYGKTKKESTAAYGASQQKIADKKKKDAMSSSDKEKLGKLADLMKKEGKVECPKCEGKGCNHCDDKGYHMKEENIDELSTKTMTSYISKASDAKGHRKLSTAKQDKRYAGVATASKKVDKKMSMEDTLASIETDRRVQKWTDFAEEYDEFKMKGKKRPQDRPLGKSDEKPPSPGANKPKDMGGEGNSEFEKHTYGATPPEGMFDKESEKSKAFIKMHQKSDSKWEDLEDESHDDVSKAGRGVKTQSPNRMGRDNRSGDTNIINKPTQKF